MRTVHGAVSGGQMTVLPPGHRPPAHVVSLVQESPSSHGVAAGHASASADDGAVGGFGVTQVPVLGLQVDCKHGFTGCWHVTLAQSAPASAVVPASFETPPSACAA